MKLIYSLFTSAVLASIALPTYAHGPTPRKTDETVLVAAKPEVVWKLLSDPCAIAKWNPELSACNSNAPNKRTLTLKNGGSISEEVDEQLPAEMSISYRLGADSEVKALPVSSLTGRIKVKAEGEGSKVSWMARYYRADTTNEPPEELNDEAAQNAVDAYVRVALKGLSAMLDKR